MGPYELRAGEIPECHELLDLMRQTNWAADRSPAGLQRMLDNSSLCVTIRHNGKLIAFGRALTDYSYRALIDDIVVDQAHRGTGLGKRIVEALMARLVEVEEIFLNTGPELEPFYAGLNFMKFDGLTMVRRKVDEAT